MIWTPCADTGEAEASAATKSAAQRVADRDGVGKGMIGSYVVSFADASFLDLAGVAKRNAPGWRPT